jgi:hypothetical protein
LLNDASEDYLMIKSEIFGDRTDYKKVRPKTFNKPLGNVSTNPSDLLRLPAAERRGEQGCGRGK